MVAELLTLNASPDPRVPVDAIYGTERWAAQNEALLRPFYDKFNIATGQELKKAGTLTTPNEVMAVAQLPSPAPAQQPISSGEFYLYLDAIQDPGNMGTILRIADWFGIRQVWCAKGCVDVFNPKTVQSGMGACLRVNTIEDADIQEIIRQNPNLPLIGTVMDGSNLFSSDKPSGGLVVIGNEGKGIRPEILPLLTHRYTIPKGSGSEAESLNAGVATGIVLGVLLQNAL